jgi:hypothetical protein
MYITHFCVLYIVLYTFQYIPHLRLNCCPFWASKTSFTFTSLKGQLSQNSGIIVSNISYNVD